MVRKNLSAVVLIAVLVMLPFEQSRAAQPVMAHTPIVEPACPQAPACPEAPPVVGRLWDVQVPPGLAQAADASSRVWNGRDPFHQPFATTDYYGSGDVDNDGALTQADLDALEAILAHALPETHRADLNGSGSIDGADLTLLAAALPGQAVLPAWWNRLSTRSERSAWVDRFIALDRTESHTWYYWYQCLDFSVQLFLRGAGYEGSLFPHHYYGGQKAFNFPLYVASVANTGFGHAINAILVGNDPLVFTDWRFIEPQTDADVHPGDASMPDGSQVTIATPEFLYYLDGYNTARHLTFQVGNGGWSVLEVDPSFIATHAEPPGRPLDNHSNTWRPILLPGEPGLILYERTGDGLSARDRLYLADFDPDGITNERLLDLPAEEYAHLLDAVLGPDGMIHLLIDGKEALTPAIFYAKIDPATGGFTDWAKINSGNVDPYMGRVLVKPGGEIHVFWFEVKNNSYDPVAPGIYWSRRTAAGWRAAQRITPEVPERLFTPAWSIYDHDVNNFLFDAEVGPGGVVYLVYTTQMMGEGLPNDKRVYLRRYTGTWSAASVVGSPPVLAYGVSTIFGPDGTLHLFGWFDPGFQPYKGLRGNLFTTRYKNGAWSQALTIDGSGKAGYPTPAFDPDGDLIVAWERQAGEQILPVFNVNQHGIWPVEQEIQLAGEWEAWNPRAQATAEGEILIYWSAQSPESVTTGWIVTQAPPVDTYYIPFIIH
jgi:hypothetical protein